MMRILTFFTCFAVIAWIGGQPLDLGAQQAADPPAGVAQLQKETPDFADVAPIFNLRCTLCHSGDQSPLGLELDSYANLMTGSQNGSVVVAGNPQGSELVRRIRGISQPRMPLTGPPWLSAIEIELIERWIAGGAPEGQKGGPAKKAAVEEVPPEATVKDPPVTYRLLQLETPGPDLISRNCIHGIFFFSSRGLIPFITAVAPGRA